MSVTSGPNISNDGLSVYFDLSNPMCFRGEPTTNSARISSDFSGTAYASADEWTPTVLKKQYDSSIITPVGSGATLIMESGGTGWHTLSRFGGGGSGNFSLSFYIKPVTNDISSVVIGLLGDGSAQVTFNLNTRAITYDSLNIPRVAFIEDVREYPGWLRVGANMFGRSGGWVGSFGYNVASQYTGSVSGKQMYVAGAVEEATFAPTKYLPAQTTRGTTVATGGGLIDISLNGNSCEFVNSPSFNIYSNKNYYITLDGINQYVEILNEVNAVSIFAFIRMNTTGGGNNTIYGPWANGHDNWLSVNNLRPYVLATETTDVNNFAVTGVSTLSTGVWYQLGCTISTNTVKIYVNGREDASVTKDFTIGAWNSLASIGRRGSISQNFFNGDIATLQVYDKVLSANEVWQNFNALRGRFGI